MKNNEVEGVLSSLHPAIVRLGIGDNNDVELVKPVVIVTAKGGPIPIRQLRARSRTGDSRGVYGELRSSKGVDVGRSQTDIDLIVLREGENRGKDSRWLGVSSDARPAIGRRKSETPSLMSMTRRNVD